MASPGVELQKAVFRALGGDAALVEALGGARIHDHAPANVAFPNITFGRTSVYDWSTGTESATEQLFTVHIWSKARGEGETLEIMKHVRARLDGQMLPMDGGAFGLHLEFAEARYDEELEIHHGMLRFRAVTEASA